MPEEDTEMANIFVLPPSSISEEDWSGKVPSRSLLNQQLQPGVANQHEAFHWQPGLSLSTELCHIISFPPSSKSPLCRIFIGTPGHKNRHFFLLNVFPGGSIPRSIRQRKKKKKERTITKKKKKKKELSHQFSIIVIA